MSCVESILLVCLCLLIIVSGHSHGKTALPKGSALIDNKCRTEPSNLKVSSL